VARRSEAGTRKWILAMWSQAGAGEGMLLLLLLLMAWWCKSRACSRLQMLLLVVQEIGRERGGRERLSLVVLICGRHGSRVGRWVLWGRRSLFAQPDNFGRGGRGGIVWNRGEASRRRLSIPRWQCAAAAAATAGDGYVFELLDDGVNPVLAVRRGLSRLGLGRRRDRGRGC